MKKVIYYLFNRARTSLILLCAQNMLQTEKENYHKPCFLIFGQKN